MSGISRSGIGSSNLGDCVDILTGCLRGRIEGFCIFKDGIKILLDDCDYSVRYQKG